MTPLLIATCSEATIETLLPLLDAAGVEVHRLTYPVIQRRGRLRIRTLIELPVCPGILFVRERDQPAFESVSMSRDARYGWMKNTAQRGELARCTFTDLAPIIHWIEYRRNYIRAKDATPPEPVQAAPARRDPEVGDRVTVVGGPFHGMPAIVIKVAKAGLTVELASSALPLQIGSCSVAPA